jgi:hypothetical protein
MNLFQFIIITIAVAIFLINFLRRRLLKESPQFDLESRRPSLENFPAEEVDNDKLILIRNSDFKQLQRAIAQFCDLYNRKSFTAIARLVKISTHEFVIFFPYNVSFDIFCYFSNYLQYPTDWTWNAEVTAWTTTEENNLSIDELGKDCKIMLFIPSDDAEGDNVFLTTSEQMGYKLSFDLHEQWQKLEYPRRKYMPAVFDMKLLENSSYDDFY